MHYHVKFPNFTIEGGRKQTTTNFSFSFKIWLKLDSKNPTVGEFFLWLLRGGICKTGTGWLRMADADGGWENTDGKMRMTK